MLGFGLEASAGYPQPELQKGGEHYSCAAVKQCPIPCKHATADVLPCCHSIAWAVLPAGIQHRIAGCSSQPFNCLISELLSSFRQGVSFGA